VFRQSCDRVLALFVSMSTRISGLRRKPWLTPDIPKPEENSIVSRVRYTITDSEGTTSFVGPGHAIKMLVAACAKEPSSLREMLDRVRTFDDKLVTDILSGLAVFDEHNMRGVTGAIDSQIAENVPDELPPFRVFNETTRAASSHPAQAGLIIFNLAARRIVQVQNSYWEIQRTDRGRIRERGKPTRSLYHYRLPSEWALVP
jgi:hypothetical protein